MKRWFRWVAILAMGLLASCEQPKNDYWLGYIEGELALIAPPQPGWITSIDVMRGAKIKPGTALFTLDAVRELAARAQVPVTIEVDAARLRPADVPYLVGDPTRTREECGWSVRIPLAQTLADVLESWRVA